MAGKLRLRAGRFGVALLSLALTLAAVESAVRVLGLFPAARAASRELPNPEPLLDGALLPWVLHPTLGWVRRPGAFRDRYEADGAWKEANSRANVLGFNSYIEDYRELEADDFVVVIFGGSVAHDLVIHAGDEVVRVVEEGRPELAGRVKVLNGAQGAYKQPQQLLGLIQLGLLQVPLDVVVNLDGFNELALGISHVPKGHHPVFPSRNQLLRAHAGSLRGMNERQLLITAEIVELRRRGEALLRFLTESRVLARSELLRSVLGAYLRDNRQRRRGLEATLQRGSRSGPQKFLSLEDPCYAPPTAPESSPPDPLACLGLVVDTWQESSRMMAEISKTLGARYLHLLQPNQHVPGAKPLTPEEQSQAATNFPIWTRSVALGYPRLRSAGLAMRPQGVDFRDWTRLFHTSTRTLYRDSCCHLNDEGNRFMARQLAKLLLE